MITVGYDEVMFSDTDASGIGHFVHQLRLFERAEYGLMEAIDHSLPVLFSETSLAVPRVHLEVDYRSPLRYGNRLELKAGISRIGGTSYTIAIEVFNLTTGRVAMTGNIVVVIIDKTTQRPVTIEEGLRKALERVLIDQ